MRVVLKNINICTDIFLFQNDVRNEDQGSRCEVWINIGFKPTLESWSFGFYYHYAFGNFHSHTVHNLLINQFIQWLLLHSTTDICISFYPHFKIRRLKGTSNRGWLRPHSYHIFYFYALHGLFDVIHEL